MMLQCRLARPVAWSITLNIVWHGPCGKHISHRASREVERVRGDPPNFGGELLDIGRWPDRSAWPAVCERCGAPVPEWVYATGDTQINPRYVLRDRLWDTPSEKLEPGCIFLADWLTPTQWASQGYSRQYWERCRIAGRILAPLGAVCPDGQTWVIDAPASNGATGADGLTDGWTVEGEPPRITCRPSIDTGTYHGWLRDGVFSDSV
jgi:hypothetical protein